MTTSSFSWSAYTAHPAYPGTSGIQGQPFLNLAVNHENKKLSNNSNIY